ncbi:hypothetical protein RQM65_06130 [Pricia sp. S334]|uniref:Uncharacterized protein n=1 Tax=Pricia mediterranea TaxID=3076079 RepID=A0ABU3L3A9_9FLAO|nr:hypothetical protein [Pricia sp. S334]MDT7828235.1 hypothetical protein [Pricia sp. S334]
MKKENEQITIKNDNGDIVGEMTLKNGALNGLCIWYNSNQNPVSCGLFSDGEPYTGTFIDWSKFIPDLEKEPYRSNLYCKDWVTMFEISHLSTEVRYNHLIETYINGQKID